MEYEDGIALFELVGPAGIPTGQMTQIKLIPGDERLEGVMYENGRVVFTTAAWYEVLLTVEWDSENVDGYRFSHTQIPDTHPLHSEAIEAHVLSLLSTGKQLLRGNTIFDPKTSSNSIILEVWQNSGNSVPLKYASLEIRRLSSAR